VTLEPRRANAAGFLFGGVGVKRVGEKRRLRYNKPETQQRTSSSYSLGNSLKYLLRE